MTNSELIVPALVTLAIGGVLMVAFPYLTGEIKAEVRREALTMKSRIRGPEKGIKDGDARRRQVAESLKELEQRTNKKVSLETKLVQAGLAWTRAQYTMLQAGLGFATVAIVFLLSGNLYLLLPALLIGVFGLPAWVLSYCRKRRVSKFIEAFPPAIDVIVRVRMRRPAASQTAAAIAAARPTGLGPRKAVGPGPLASPSCTGTKPGSRRFSTA